MSATTRATLQQSHCQQQQYLQLQDSQQRLQTAVAVVFHAKVQLQESSSPS
jgi:hypothetical protein